MMRRTLDLAMQGVGQVSPGPLVGTIIVNDEGKIVGEGFYLFDRLKHAETIALEQARERASNCTAYVSLEPHAHHGRTPPCTEALINAGIKRVVAPIEDPNPDVSGRGFAQLRAAGIEVWVGLLADEAARLNEAYVHFMKTRHPFVHLKLAISLDGKIATHTGDSRWITGEAARTRVHELRHRYDAIMVGGGTVAADDPLLTDRSGKKRRRPLLRVLVDKCLRMSPSSQLASSTDQAPVLLFTDPTDEATKIKALESRGVEVIDKGYDLKFILNELGNRSIQSVLVEGGSTLAGLLMDSGLVNKVTFFIAPIIIGNQSAPSAIGGLGAERIAEAIRLDQVEVLHHGRDVEITGYPKKRSGQ